MEEIQETGRQRFIRNTGESIRMMRAKAIEMRRDGEFNDAERVDRIAATWSEILEVAERQEATEM